MPVRAFIPEPESFDMEITYQPEVITDADEIIILYEKAGLPRPTHDRERIAAMYAHSNLVLTARQGAQLVGICRCITDWVWSCYLADLAVDPDLQKAGIGRELIRHTREVLGKQSIVLLLSVPTAMTYYPKVGFDKEDRAFMIPREE